MKPIFPKGIDNLKPVIFLTGGISAIGIILIFNFYFTDAHLSVGYQPDQPIPFSHRLHAGELGIDCRYCHVNVEKSPHASVPPSDVCMNCHSQIKKESPALKPLFEIYQQYLDKEVIVAGNKATPVKERVENEKFRHPLPWVRIHNVPDYAYFDHSAHINANVGCVECHGRIDQMIKVKQEKPLTMAWCLECHRNYQDHVRPEHVSVTDMAWSWEKEKTASEKEFKASLKSNKKLNPPEECSACHR